ncbi:hypothetical protein BHE74_00003787 [Ensete ventricosum]|nr:hypothetical protein BHE74_00003787 [Ensete ventricosum]
MRRRSWRRSRRLMRFTSSAVPPRGSPAFKSCYRYATTVGSKDLREGCCYRVGGWVLLAAWQQR